MIRSGTRQGRNLLHMLAAEPLKTVSHLPEYRQLKSFIDGRQNKKKIQLI